MDGSSDRLQAAQTQHRYCSAAGDQTPRQRFSERRTLHLLLAGEKRGGNPETQSRFRREEHAALYDQPSNKGYREKPLLAAFYSTRPCKPCVYLRSYTALISPIIQCINYRIWFLLEFFLKQCLIYECPCHFYAITSALPPLSWDDVESCSG